MTGLNLVETVPYNADSTSPLTVFKPPSTAVDDLLIVSIVQDAGLLSDLSTPSGWTAEENPVDIASQRARVFSHVVTGGDPGSWDFPYNAGASIAAMLFRFTEADGTPSVSVTSNNTASNGSTLDSPTGTPPGGGGDADLAIITNAGANAAFSYTAPSGLSDLGSTQAVGGLYQAMGAAWKTVTDGSPTGVQTWSGISPTSRAAGSFTILIKWSGQFDPDPPPNPPPPLVPPWLLRELVAARQEPLVGHHRTPVIKQALSGGASGANVTLTTAATTDTTDLLVVFHGNNFYTAAQLGPPTTGSWTLQATGDNGTNAAHMKVFTASATGGAQTVTCTPAIDEEHTVTLFVISGADLTSPADGATGGNGASSTSHIAPSVTPATFYPLLLIGTQAVTEGDYTLPSTRGLRKTSEVDVPGFCTGATGAEVLAGPGATGTRTFTVNVASAYATATIAVKALQPPASGGGGPATVNLDGSIASSGALTKQVAKPLAGTLTSAGVLAKQAAKALAGSIAMSGVLSAVKVVLRNFAGTLTSAGALAKLVAKPLAGTATSSGALAKQDQKPLAGTLSPAGALAKQVAKALAGALTPSGALGITKVVLRSFAGTLTSAGTLARQAAKALAGTSTLAGTVAKQDQKALAGTLTSSGALAKLAKKALAGTLTSSGALTTTKVVVRALAGTLTSSGALARQAGKSLAGAITPTGVLSRAASKALAGVVNLAAALAKLGRKVFAGQATPSGSLDATNVGSTVNATSAPGVAMTHTSTAAVTARASSTAGTSGRASSSPTVSDG